MMSKLRIVLIVSAFALCLAGYALAAGPAAGTEGVKISDVDGKLRVEINGQLFTEYIYKDTPRPYLYPIIAPTGDSMIRNFPMKKDVENEPADHPHHRSLWYTHGNVNGVDFWGEKEGVSGKIAHDKFLETSSGKEKGVIKATNKWVAADGKTVCTDTRTMVFYNAPDCQVLDFIIAYHASEGELTLGDTKEGSMAIRLAPTLCLKGAKGNKVAEGQIVNSEGVTGGDTWGKRANWVDYYGPLNGKIVGVAVFDHPSNPKHPTWWHVRDYGLFAANPFGVHDFEKKPDGIGNIVVPKGQDLTFRYRWYFHKGDEKESKVAERYEEYAKTKAAE